MIFVTVGTHEQPFNRLVKGIDDLKLEGKITDEVFIQSGYSTYIPKACQYEKFISVDRMNDYMQKARVIITHGGPSSFILALQNNKIPIVVPRLAKFHEHINNHQLTFCNELVSRKFPICVVDDISMLEKEVKDSLVTDQESDITLNNKQFVQGLKSIVANLL
ncbi:multidrug MFS transporter [Pediococcus inopinatus]|uniref:Multidrug MFS transporter n=1 Tax=Pediococcus inopinatus TaxID=114090 RepID=A0ABZ0Q8C4_9LACO|nr:glycosyltransferase [Pediococcus inopinatus]WPC22378.1 multidrug MFS transporter [Pediococcus inopinatus]